MKNQYICVLVSFFCIISSKNAQANVCNYNIDYGYSVDSNGNQTGGKQVSNGFQHYTRLWCYSGSYWAKKYLRDYDFNPIYWGHYNGVTQWGPGNTVSFSCAHSHYPFHRIMSAYRFIDYVGTYTSFNSSKTWDEMARNNIDETRIACSSSSGNTNARMDFYGNMTVFYQGIYESVAGTTSNPIYRGNSLGELASLIVHESRHAWCWHNGESCGGNSCDESWSDSCVNKDEIRFLWDVYKKFPVRQSQNLTPPSAPINRSNNQEYLLSEPQLELMRDKGNYRLRSRFDTPPTFVIRSTRPWVLN